jgi:hypothetical protein
LQWIFFYFFVATVQKYSPPKKTLQLISQKWLWYFKLTIDIYFLFFFWFLGRGLGARCTHPIYLSTLANLTLITLFSEILKFSKIISSKSKNLVKENSEYLGIFHLLN